MTGLLAMQEQFLACLLDEAVPSPVGQCVRRASGMQVYRSAYRARLIEVVRDTFSRTARLVGDEAFQRAAAHHLIRHPPSGWTIDLAGGGFPDTCAELFARDSDVAELAWLEWAMHSAFTAADGEPMSVVGFAAATADFVADQWDGLRMEFMPGTALRPVTYDLVKLWESLAEPAREPELEMLLEPQWVLLWREAERPVVILLSEENGSALAELQRGGTFGGICSVLAQQREPADAAAAAGAMLMSWLELGIVRSVRTT